MSTSSVDSDVARADQTAKVSVEREMKAEHSDTVSLVLVNLVQ